MGSVSENIEISEIGGGVNGLANQILERACASRGEGRFRYTSCCTNTVLSVMRIYSKIWLI